MLLLSPPLSITRTVFFRFGFSTREFVVLHELSAEGKGGDELDVEMEDTDDIDISGVDERVAKEEKDAGTYGF